VGYLHGSEPNFLLLLPPYPALDSKQDKIDAATFRQMQVSDTSARCGNVRSAAEPCRLSSASPPRNSSSDPRLSTSTLHESISPASNLSRASAHTLVLCLVFVRMQDGGAIQTLRCAAPHQFSLPPATKTQAL
jgi:hypothetical protein